MIQFTMNWKEALLVSRVIQSISNYCIASSDPVYDKVKNMIRQETSTSEGSHIYSTVHSLDLQVPPTTSGTE